MDLESIQAPTIYSSISGNGGIISSTLWLALAVALCIPSLFTSSHNTDESPPKSVSWFVILAIDLILAAVSVFSLWFRKRALSILLIIWGGACILATFLLGSLAMFPAVATMCCCAEDICLTDAMDTSPLNYRFCRQTYDMCRKTEWSLWCYYGGILLAMVSVVLLVNSIALHRKVLDDHKRCNVAFIKSAHAADQARMRFGHTHTYLDEAEDYFRCNLSSRHREVDREQASNPRWHPSTARLSRPIYTNTDENIVTPVTGPPAQCDASISCQADESQAQGEHHTKAWWKSGWVVGKPAVEGISSTESQGYPEDDQHDQEAGISWQEEEGGNDEDGTITESKAETLALTPRTALRFKTSALARAIHN